MIGILATLESELIAGEMKNDLVMTLAMRLRNAGVLPSGGGDLASLRLALADLNQRVRYALGEYDEPPAPDDGLVDHHVEFDSEAGAIAFFSAMDRLGLRARRSATEPQAPDTILVTVTSGEVLLSPGFEERDKQIEASAREAGGRYVGWGGSPQPEPPQH